MAIPEELRKLIEGGNPLQAGGTQGVPSSVLVSLQLKYPGDNYNPPADGTTGTATWEYGG